MLSSNIIYHFEELLSEKIIANKPLSGGDINAVYLLISDKQKVVVKLNLESKFPKMFETEAQGLQKLKDTSTFIVPEILHIGVVDNIAFLMLQYIDQAKSNVTFWENFGKQLGRLHRNTESYFGLEENNYIGSLPQYNSICESASEFYITQRLEPQFKIASQNGFSFSRLSGFYKNISEEIPDEASSLIHGDLWRGNYMVSQGGEPCLIDPAVAYAPREMDIAMMHLFGGFNSQLFKIYNEVFPLQMGWNDRISIFQLYYLLVHLNVFGSSYYNQVKNIVNRYF
ncbi:fructosamine kinase family protein [Aquimarina gracilis]|uniref:Fructosamine kinase family protein n=1 Tax=Aquimarina gracilis TaxID=874422 RepID=A0ABU5ZPG7_9FLAO|nr:fructosamine kinase family protein [Aquimarina gracilis]MEB3344007.1 fructosamine kinase family protein [Aquimarina gracilis]